MPTLALLHWRIELPPLVAVEKAALPLHEELPLWRIHQSPRVHIQLGNEPVVAATVASVEAEAHADVEARHTRKVALAEAGVREVALEQRASGTVGLAARPGLAEDTTRVPLQDCQSSQLREAEQIVLTPSGTLVVVDSPFFRARSWVKGPPVLVSDGVMVLSQLFLKVNTWSAMAGVLIARAMARAAVTRENMLRRCVRRLDLVKELV
jgi:hypothetical protein